MVRQIEPETSLYYPGIGEKPGIIEALAPAGALTPKLIIVKP
jgi:hypothetical protein